MKTVGKVIASSLLVFRILTVAVAVGMWACGGGAWSPVDDGGDICDSLGSVQLLVTPSTVQRGEATEITVLWQTNAEVNQPSATFTLDTDSIEVEVPLFYDASAPGETYLGTQLNPYGVGAPSGAVHVLAAGEPFDGCTFALTDTFVFDLQ